MPYNYHLARLAVTSDQRLVCLGLCKRLCLVCHDILIFPHAEIEESGSREIYKTILNVKKVK